VEPAAQAACTFLYEIPPSLLETLLRKLRCHEGVLKMPPVLKGSVDAKNKFEDLSGVDIAAYPNPYDALIEACNHDPVNPYFLFLNQVTLLSIYCILSDNLKNSFSQESANISRLSFNLVMPLTAQLVIASRKPNFSL
jgi:hypothetical protein